ncbi:PREDICTED: putative callose synthase 8 isoform X2 [Nelumbo nucifera]|uniref:1,3-beta-glucan synthase n=1 Tax=Nelumbo nucifera TaxID=4432 RepID=A0A1U8A8C7_NELNU|nr:PREDICTED: putative callose synthase 8 isoform X2 [Nelumbo nucifera]
MAEIVLAESSHRRRKASPKPLSRSRTEGYVPEPFDSETLPPTLSSEIQRFLRVANEIQYESPRVAYLCRFHAFERAHNMDPSSSGRKVRQFKTALLQRLEQDENITYKWKKRSDAHELRDLYHRYKDCIDENTRLFGKENREQLANARIIAYVLYEVLETVTSGTASEILADGEEIEAKSKLYVPYNILPLDPGGVQQPIMQFPEIIAAVAAVRNIRGLPLANNHQEPADVLDLFEWLQCWFGFQKGNVANQREHLILLLANIHIRLTPKHESTSELGHGAVDELMKKLFKNYTNWCKFLGRKSNIRLPSVGQGVQQYKILYMGLYLLIWGEASNLRFMPECLCYLFHHMAHELYGVLSGGLSITEENKIPAYGRGAESFLEKVVTPIYRVIFEEATKEESGLGDHSKWRNYDDLNEFFWSLDCFQLGWPLYLDHDFFRTQPFGDGHVTNASLTDTEENMKKEEKEEVKILFGDGHDTNASLTATEENRKKEEKEEVKITSPKEDHKKQWLGKTNFVEIRSFWHLFRSFDRMWTFFILALQAMIIMAWHGLESPFQFYDAEVLEDIMSIFITSAILNLVKAILDIVFMWKARHLMDFSQILRYILKLVVSVTWIIILPVYYADSRRHSTCHAKQYGSWVGEWCVSSYMVAIAFYLVTNAVGLVLFLVPAVGRYIETSNLWVFTVLSWWSQPCLYVGRGMQENLLPCLKYTLFWVLLLLSKFAFSYHFEVWYSVYCTIFGGVYGVFRHLGEIRTMGMLRSRFQSLPSAFNVCLVPPSSKNGQKNVKSFFHLKINKVSENEKNGVAKFAQVWNQIIDSLRSEDLISNRERDLMTITLSSELTSGLVCWPVFLLATKLSTAFSIAKDFVGKDENLFKKIKKDYYMYCAVKECYESLKYIFKFIVKGDLEKRIVTEIISEVEASISRSSLLIDFKMSELPGLHSKCIDLVNLLLMNRKHHEDSIIMILQDIFEVVTKDMMTNGSRILDLIQEFQPTEEDPICYFREIEPQLFASSRGKPSAILYPIPDGCPLMTQIKRLLLLLTVNETAMEIPVNIEARRRISFFATSLFMDMPIAPKVRSMLSFSVLTPLYMEEVKFSLKDHHSSQKGVSILFYMKRIYPDVWRNFLERMECEDWDELEEKHMDELISKKKHMYEELRNWASFRGQTLSRTVRGMMYYRKALKLQAFLDMNDDMDIIEGYKAIEMGHDKKDSYPSLSAQLDALTDMKFAYIISCQEFGAQKACGDPRAQDILDLMIRYPSLRVAYVEEKEEIVGDKPQKVYSSILVKAINTLDQEIYRIKLPGPPNIGEGKPENQNHAIIFTRGDALQTIDMNQDNYMEEAFKMRNVLQEFLRNHGRQPPTIIGLREYIFTESISTLARFMSYQESSFVTIGQRLTANPLRVRFHYGHPDLFDRIFHITRGGISKASKTINLSEDVFAGFNSILRKGHVVYHEYMQIGKGRDVGLNQISKFEAKVSNGNSEQTLSRDIYRLGHRFDFFRMLSCYFTTVGFYFNSLLSVIGIYVFLYGQLYLILSGLEKALLLEARTQNIESLETALASQSFIQLGLLTGLPMVMEIGLEKGFLTAFKDFILMQLQLAAVFFTFSLGTKSHYYGRTILHGGAKYRPTGRKVVVFHANFSENYRLYSRSHFVKGFELLLLLIVYNLFRRSYVSSMTYVLITYSIWFMLMTWLFAPFLFNPSGFNWGKIVEDWKEWNGWIKNHGGIGVHQENSWESWWNDEQSHLRHSGLCAKMIEVFLSLRFFIYQYGLVYHLDISQDNKNFLVYVLSWFVLGAIFLLVKAMNEGRRRLSANYHLGFRLLKALLFLGVLSIIVTLSVICDLSVMDLIVCCLAFLPTGWGLLSIAQAVRPMIEDTGLWDFVIVLAQAYDYGMGVVLFAPIAVLAWLPIISAFQTRFLFYDAINRRLQIKPILAGSKKH